MKRTALLTILNLLCVTGLVTGQSLKIINKTGLVFEKVVTYKEREEGRHTYEYDPKSRYGKRDYKTPEIQMDTLNYSSNIKFRETGKYTLVFIGKGDTLCYLFGLDLSKTKEISLGKNNLVYSKKPKQSEKLDNGSEIISMDKTSDHGMVVMDEEGRIDLFFNFINNTSYTIYAIYPWISDEKDQRGTILYHDPDRKILPKEQRKLTVIEDRLENSYSNQKISFKIAALDSASNLVFFKVNNIELSTDNVLIDDKSIELMK